MGTEHIEIKGLEVIDTEHPTINPKDKCNIHFTVEWPKEKATEIEGNEEATFELQIEYTQATTESFDGKPSHEDIVGNTVGGGEVTSPTEDKRLVSQIIGADYGKRINYKATVQGQEVSNWRVFLNDGKNVYIILDDYLPVSLVPTAAGFTTKPTERPYSVWSASRDSLISSLITQKYWSEFANGVKGATATGSPTYTQFVASWNANPKVNIRQLKEGEDYYEGNNGGRIEDPTKLYIPHTEQVESTCDAYWLATPSESINIHIWYVHYNGDVHNGHYSSGKNLGIRPVICLPSDIEGKVGEAVEI